ncbi:hypothetical protein ACLOJK_039631 [Asimina triloba]
MENCDFFSNLPEALLILIISFLPVRDAMMTTLLSKQWLNLWTNITAIDINGDQFLDTERQSRLLGAGRKGWAMHIKKAGRRRVAEFVCKILRRLESPKISKFALRLGYQAEYGCCIEEWIRFAISKEVEELHLYFFDGDLSHDKAAFDCPQFNLPDFLCTYKSLRVLELDSCKFSSCDVPCFSALKILSLARMKVPQKVIEYVVLNCPYLQNLSLVECCDLYCLKICASRLPLKSLIVRDCAPLSQGIELCAPVLEYLEYSGHMVTLCIENLVSLVNVLLDFGPEDNINCQYVEPNNLLRNLNHAKNMTISCCVMQPFNLKNLTLTTDLLPHELQGLLWLLRSSPDLASLTIRTGRKRHLNEDFYSKSELTCSDYLLSVRLSLNNLKHLQMVKMEVFSGHPNEIELLKFLLEIALTLETMTIMPSRHMFPGSDGRSSLSIARVMEELQSVEIASPNVTILFS